MPMRNFSARSEKLLHENMQKNTKNHKEFIQLRKIKAKRSENNSVSHAKL